MEQYWDICDYSIIALQGVNHCYKSVPIACKYSTMGWLRRQSPNRDELRRHRQGWTRIHRENQKTRLLGMGQQKLPVEPKPGLWVI